MSLTLNQILLDSASVLDLSAEVPTGDELSLRINYANQALEDAAATGQFPEFKKVYEILVVDPYHCTLPSGFRELHTNPQALGSSGWREFPEIDMELQYENDDYWCYVSGNPKDGYLLHFNGLETGMSLSVIYQAFPARMATTTDVCELSDPTYITRKVESYVLYSRGDDRFQQAEARANNVLLNMTGRKMKGAGGQGKDTPMKFINPLE